MPVIAPEALAKHLEAVGSTLSEHLEGRHGDGALVSLVQSGAVSRDVSEFLRKLGVAPERAGDVFWPLALFSDCLTIIVLPRFLVTTPRPWDSLEPLRPFLMRAASFYASVNPRYQPFKSLPK